MLVINEFSEPGASNNIKLTGKIAQPTRIKATPNNAPNSRAIIFILIDLMFVEFVYVSCIITLCRYLVKQRSFKLTYKNLHVDSIHGIG